MKSYTNLVAGCPETVPDDKSSVFVKGLKKMLKTNPSKEEFDEIFTAELHRIESNMSRCLKEDPKFRVMNRTALDKIAKKYEKQLHIENLRLEAKAAADSRFHIDARNRLVASAAAAAFAESSTLPIDTTKVRLQLQVNAAKGSGTPQYKGMVDCFLQIARNEGLGGLWRGVTPALVRQVSYTSLTFALYEPVRDFIARDPTKEISLWQRFLAGGLSAGIGIAIMNPTEIVKTKMQGVPHAPLS